MLPPGEVSYYFSEDGQILLDQNNEIIESEFLPKKTKLKKL